jgi:sulfur-carrier protein
LGLSSSNRAEIMPPMARVFIPAQWRDLTAGQSEVKLEGSTLGQVITALERRFPGIAGRVCDGPAIAGGLAVSIDGAMTSRGLLAPVGVDSEIHFLPAIGGG